MGLDLNIIKQTVEDWSYLIVILGVSLESAGVPFPGETVLLVAAAIAAFSSRLHLEWIILWAALGAILGDSLGYWAGRELGSRLLDKIAPLLHFNANKRARIEKYFDKHGSKTVFIGRFIAFLRTWVAFFAGINGMPYPTFLKFNVLGAFVWATLFGLLGYFFGQNLPLLEKWLGNFSLVALGLVLAGLAGFFFFKRLCKTKPV